MRTLRTRRKIISNNNNNNSHHYSNNNNQNKRNLLLTIFDSTKFSISNYFTTFIGSLRIGVRGPAITEQPYNEKIFHKQRTFKHLMYSQLTTIQALGNLAGTTQPLTNFIIQKDPPYTIFNWEINPNKVNEFVNDLNFPNYFEIVPIKILDNEVDARYYLSLYIFEIKGLGGFLSGIRTDWTIYVCNNKSDHNNQNNARSESLVVDAKHSAPYSLNPVDGFTIGINVHHSNTTAGIETYLSEQKQYKNDGNSSSNNTKLLFESFITREGIIHAERVLPTREWLSANDRTIWLNGVADRVYYDSTFYNTPVLSVNPDYVSIIVDNTQFKDYVNTTKPVSVVVFENQVDCVVTPWYNLDPE